MVQVTYKIIQIKDFIKVRPTGEVDLEQSKQILNEMIDISRVPGEFDILLDVREAFGNLTHDEVCELVQVLGQQKTTPRKKIAVLARNDEQFNKAAFAEMCSNLSTHGFRLVAFMEFERATEWLTSEGGLDELWG